MRYIHNFSLKHRDNEERMKGPFSAEEVGRPEIYWIKYAQSGLHSRIVNPRKPMGSLMDFTRLTPDDFTRPRGKCLGSLGLVNAIR